jgi:mono/diheme cytochrome c family protein
MNAAISGSSPATPSALAAAAMPISCSAIYGVVAMTPVAVAEWNRGAYLTEGLAHCGLCHTPKNFLGGDKTNERLRGYALQGWFAADISNDTYRGLGGWLVDDTVAYLKTLT